MGGMKQAFDQYFENLREFSQKIYNTKPTVFYSDNLNKHLLVMPPNVEGEVEWYPVLQNKKFDFCDIENKLGFEMSKDLKSYYSSYLFLYLDGKFGKVYLYFHPLMFQETIPSTILLHYHNGQYVFPNTRIFSMGSAIVNGDDSLLIFYDNTALQVFYYESEKNEKCILSDSLEYIIGQMEAC